MTPRISVRHKYGNVFLRLTGKYPVTLLAKLDPNTADLIADSLRTCASRARKDKKPAKREPHSL